MYVNALEDQPLPIEMQKSGDCSELRCDGQGKVKNVPVELDAEDDGKPCTLDVCIGTFTQHQSLSSIPCYTGPIGTEIVGNCRSGRQACTNDVPTGACMGERVPSVETCWTMYDDDCDGSVSEEGVGCVCVPGSLGTCYPGQQETLGNAPCSAGQQPCNASGTAYEACVGFVAPNTKMCDAAMLEEDCDGLINEDGASCTCGDGVVSGVEQCDDGNTVDGDACSSSCRIPGCGDGTVSGGEVCDDGNRDDGDACTNQCKNAQCGDGHLQCNVEQCDDGNMNDLDGCTNACKLVHAQPHDLVPTGVRKGSQHRRGRPIRNEHVHLWKWEYVRLWCPL